jgi:uncharacterized membrane protein
MSPLLVALSTGLHVLATVVFVGYYLFTGLIYLPVLQRCVQPNALREIMEQVSARLRPFFGGSLLVFLATGTHLMLINDSYRGLGNIFANPWSILIVVKHALVLAFLVVAVSSERILLPQISAEKPQVLKRFQWAQNMNVVLGTVIVLMTAVAQAG